MKTNHWLATLPLLGFFLVGCGPSVSVDTGTTGAGTTGAGTTGAGTTGAGTTGAGTTGAGEGGTTSGTGTSAGGTGGMSGDGGPGGAPGQWTDCSSPDGYQVCGGTHGCSASCVAQGAQACIDPASLSPCETPAFNQLGNIMPCEGLCADGQVCFTWSADATFSSLWECAPFNLGVLYGNNGAGPDRLRYADWGIWAGGPLPEPTACPTFDGFQICGGHCGGCPSDHLCSGRSHLHPYGLCVPTQATLGCTAPGVKPSFPCQAGEQCFIYTVEPEAQPLADKAGFCLPQDTCQKVAANYPGGGKCVP